MYRLALVILVLLFILPTFGGCAGVNDPADGTGTSDNSSNASSNGTTSAPDSGTTKEPIEDDQMFTYLNNTYYKLTKDKSLNIVYMGGSVTSGYGASDQNTKSWRAYTTKWIKECFPDATVNGINAAIGGTGSYLADFRFDTDVAAKDPDLLFIEFAINDRYNAQTQENVVRTSETLVQKAYAANPNIDIVYVLTFDQSVRQYDYEQLKGHRDVAKKYGLPFIKLGKSFYSMLQKTGDDFSKYFMDSVHPNDVGYEYYFGLIKEFLGSELIKDTAVETELKAKTLPEKNVSKLPLMTDARLIVSNKIDLSSSDGWKHQAANFSYMGMRYSGRVFSNTVGSKLTFTFEGTDVGLLYGIGPSMGKVSCTVDGGDPVVIDAYSASLNPKEKPLTWSLAPGKHTVVIELLGEKNSSSQGHDFEIGAILVN